MCFSPTLALHLTQFLDRLPRSISAVVYGVGTGGGDMGQARQAWLQLLRDYGLSKRQIPLLKANFDADGAEISGEVPIFTDMSDVVLPDSDKLSSTTSNLWWTPSSTPDGSYPAEGSSNRTGNSAV